MSTSSSAAGSVGSARAWVTSMGGPLVVVPVSALTAWGGCTEAGMVIGDGDLADDYDRACAVEGLAEAVAVDEDGIEVLVLADEPATTCYLPEQRAA